MSYLARALAGVRFIGLNGVRNAVRYALVRDRLERRFRSHRAPDEWASPGPLREVQSFDGGARWLFANTELEVTFLAPNLVRCEWAGGPPPLPYALARTEWPSVDAHLQERSDGWLLRSDELMVSIRADGGLSFADGAGRRLRDESPPVRIDGGWVHQAALRPEERIYGLGERASALNLRGGVYRMWNRDPASTYSPGHDPLYVCIPVYLALHHAGSYLVFYENSFDATFDLGATDASAVQGRFSRGMLREYFIVGPPARALARYTELTGRPPLPPRWALGYHQSRWGYRTAADVRSVVEGFERHDLPLQAMHLDLDYMDGYRTFTVDETRFPDLAALARELAAHDVRLVAIINPGVKWDREYDVLQDGLAGGHFCTTPDGEQVRAPVWPGECAFPDFTQPATRLWWGQYYARLLEAGIAGYWHDMNEPAVFAAWGEPTLPLTTRHHLEGRGGDHREAHNVYGLLQAQAAHESLRARRPDSRPFIISRSGWAGLQRYGWTWTGDTVSTWEGLRQSIATVLGLGLSGIAYSGPDIGGFSGTPSSEMFLRWFQMATFLPFFRTHSAVHTPRREPWTFGEPWLSVLREFLRLRKRLLPYLYTLCWEAEQTGAPLARPTFWPDPGDASLWDVDDAFLLGNDLLVAPVLEPDATSREVVLPAGYWYSLWDDACFQGPQRIDCAAPLERMPVLVRAGSSLPLVEGDHLVLNLYMPPSGTGGGRLYSDAGEGYGAWRLDRFATRRDLEGIMVEWQTEGEYPLLYADIEIWLHGATARRVYVDGESLAASGERFSVGTFRRVRIEEMHD